MYKEEWMKERNKHDLHKQLAIKATELSKLMVHKMLASPCCQIRNSMRSCSSSAVVKVRFKSLVHAVSVYIQSVGVLDGGPWGSMFTYIQEIV